MTAMSCPTARIREIVSNNLCSYNGATDGGTSSTATCACESSWNGAVNWPNTSWSKYRSSTLLPIESAAGVPRRVEIQATLRSLEIAGNACWSAHGPSSRGSAHGPSRASVLAFRPAPIVDHACPAGGGGVKGNPWLGTLGGSDGAGGMRRLSALASAHWLSRPLMSALATSVKE